MKKVLQIDPEFKRLSVPLSAEEQRRLENSLIREGCKEPITVWHGCILDGYKRYEICSYEEIEFEVQEMDFPTREEAVFWAARMKIASVPRESPIYRYLAGKVYLNTKALIRKHKWAAVSESVFLLERGIGKHALALVGKEIFAALGGAFTAQRLFAAVAAHMTPPAGEDADREHAVVLAALAARGRGLVGELLDLFERQHRGFLTVVAVAREQRRTERAHDACNVGA